MKVLPELKEWAGLLDCSCPVLHTCCQSREDMPEEGAGPDAKSILGLRDKPAGVKRVCKHLSTATSLAVRRKTVNQKLIWVPSLLVTGYRRWESRVSARERGA